MKFHSLALLTLCTALVAEASSGHIHRTSHFNHRKSVSRRNDGFETKVVNGKRCRVRPEKQNQNQNQGQNQNQTGQAGQQNSAPNNNNNGDGDKDKNNGQNDDGKKGENGQTDDGKKGENGQNDDGKKGDNGQNQNTDGKGNSSNTGNNDNNNSKPTTGGAIDGVLSVASTCGDVGATRETSNESGPNGAMYWVNCGVEDASGWRPQNVPLSALKIVDLREAIKDPNTPFKACTPFIDKFISVGNELGVPPTLLASFAMQESTCNPQPTGGGGEVGLMQITPDKCGGAPGGNCYDVDFNLRTGAQFFKTTLDNAGGNVFQAIGQYNGWQPGLTIGSATAAANGPCCRCQNNLDYIFQMVNGWLQNIDPYSRRLGKYFNLDQCH